FVVSRERVHWASLAMASYIFATSVVPRLPAGTSTEGSTAGKGRSYGGYSYHDDEEEDSTLHSPGLHPYDDSPAMTSKRRGGYRQRADYYHDEGGGIGTTITHLDDHAEQLWHNSPAIRAAAAAAAAAAADAAGDSLDREAAGAPPPPPPSPGAAASEREAWEEGAQKEEQHRAPRGPFDGSVEGEGLVSDGEGLDSDGPAVDDDDVGVDPDLRTHFDLGDLELAAEKALDLLRDSGDVSGGDGGGDGATEPEAGIDDSGPDSRPDLEGLELAAEKALDLLRDDGGGGRGQDSAGRQGDGGTSAAAAAAAASVSGRSTGVPVRLSIGVDTDSAAAVPARGGAAPVSADSTRGQDANRQQEQEEEEGKSSSSTGVAAVVGGKEKASGGRLTLPSPPTPAPKVPPAAIGGRSGGGGGTPGRHSTSFVAVAARAVSPAVCRIDMERLVGSRHDGAPFTDVETGQGSGLIFSSEDGLVLTNAHVVAGARKVTVTLTDGRKFLAEVKGSDALSDLAVLKIDRDASLGQTPLPEVTLGDSQELQVGDWVIAVGNPVGLDSTVTLGIVSSMKRSSEEVGFPDRKVNFIQTDAAINPGNSGGPLVNEFGEVVGVNTAVRANTEGIGFAIPINKAKAIMYDLAKGNRIEYAYIGITMTTITPEFALQNNRDPNSHQLIPEVNGAIIMKVLPGTPAADAGLRRHDVVIEMRGRAIRTADEAKQVVDESSVGDVLTLKV
ncbi:unnamed protein product, partial [Ectocarpus fasciculatus]